MLRRGLVLDILLQDRVSLYMWYWRTMNATDNEAHRVLIADGIDLYDIPSSTNSCIKQIYIAYLFNTFDIFNWEKLITHH